MEERQELAGHLLAELQDSRHQYEHGRMPQAEFLSRVAEIRHRREAAQAAHHTAVVFHDPSQVRMF